MASNVNSLNQSTAFNVDINALNAYNQNNSLSSIGVSSLSGSSFGNSLKTTDISGAEIDWESTSLGTGTSYYRYTANSNVILLSDSPYYSEYAAEFDDVSYDFSVNAKNSDLTDSDILEQMASKYVDLRNNILENYLGEEAEDRLTQLDKAYEDMIKTNVSPVFKSGIEESIEKGSVTSIWQQIKAGMIEKYGSLPSTLQNSSYSNSYELYDISYNGNISQSLYNSEDNTLMLAKKAVQYILDGNSVPVTDEEKEAFNEYISEGTDGTIGNLSYSDLKTTANICNYLSGLCSTILSRSDFDALYNAINNSNFSDDLKGVFNNFLYSMKIADSSSPQEDNSDVEKRIQEIIEQRELMKLEMQKAQADSAISGEEKYSMYIKSAKQNAAIDTSLDEIINEIINYYNDEQ